MTTRQQRRHAERQEAKRENDPKIAAEMVERDLARVHQLARANGIQRVGFDGKLPDHGDGAGTMAMVTLSGCDELDRAAIARAAGMWRKVKTKYPKGLFTINLAGFDEDPREIPDIPDAAAFFRGWAQAVGIDTVEEAVRQGLELTSLQVLAACGAFGTWLQEEMRKKQPPVKEN
jgi:hypothetical protein